MRMSALFLALLLLPLAASAAEKRDITFTLKAADAVVFSHEYHTGVKGIKCSACHFQTFTAAEGGYALRKEKLTKRDFCEHCHNGLKGFDAESPKNCTRCHRKK